MKKFLVAFFALVFLMGGSASVAMAQADATPAAGEDEPVQVEDAGGATASATGLDAPATYFAANGSEVATVKVVGVERGWQDFGEYYEPDAGVEYIAVTFEIEAVSRGNVPVESYDFSMLDAFGFNNSSSFLEAAEDSEVQLLEEDTSLASGESGEFTLVFEVFEGTELGFFMWQPDSGVIVLVNLAGE
jgi:elongation factor P hydroxylase